MRLKNYCIPLQSARLSYVTFYWKDKLKEEYDLLSRFLYPTDELAISYPKNPWFNYRIVVHKDGRIVGINDDDVTDRLKLTKADIIEYKIDLKQFRREICETFDLIPSTEEIGNLSRGVSWGTWEPEKGVSFPVTMLCLNCDVRGHIFERILRRKAPGEMVITPTRLGWKDDIDELCRANKTLLVPLDEIVQMKDDKLLPTPEWDEYLIAFCKMVDRDLPSRLRDKPQRNLFAKRGEWMFRYAGKDVTVSGNLQGPAFIRRLMMAPHEEIHVEQLLKEVCGTGGGSFARVEAGAEGEWDSFLSPGDDVLDAAGKADYQKRLLQLNRDRTEAEAANNSAWLERIDSETEAISNQLDKTVDGKGKSRKLGNERDRLRKRISRNITFFLDKIREEHWELANHLEKSLDLGEHMVYRPDKETEWSLE